MNNIARLITPKLRMSKAPHFRGAFDILNKKQLNLQSAYGIIDVRSMERGGEKS